LSEVVGDAARAITERTRDRVTRADLLTTLAIFGKLAQPGFNALEIVGREAMKESKLYQEIQEEARVEARRAAVRDVLEVRFGEEAAAQFQAPLQAIADEKMLSELLRLATRCRRLSEFRKALLAEVERG
jgi:predicted transposase YdaD